MVVIRAEDAYRNSNILITVLLVVIESTLYASWEQNNVYPSIPRIDILLRFFFMSCLLFCALIADMYNELSFVTNTFIQIIEIPR